MCGIRNPVNGIQNPKSGIQPGMESVIHSVESGIQDSLGLPYMGRNWTMMMSPELLPILTREAVTCMREGCGIWLKVTKNIAQIDVSS